MRLRPLGIMKVTALIVLLMLVVAVETDAAEPAILILTPTLADDRVEPSQEAIAFWNDRLAEVGVRLRLADAEIVVESPALRTLET